MTLFDLGPPVKTIYPVKPMGRVYFLAAYMGGENGYWRIWKDLWLSQEAAEREAAKLAPCWVERRIYVIPGDE